jgi:hypothetical protein
MDSRICPLAFGILLLSSCTPHSATPDGAVILDEDVALTRGASLDSAQRDITADADSVIVVLDLLAQQFSADFYRRFTSGENATQALSETQRAWLAPQPGLSEAAQQRRRITALAHGSYTQ